MDTRINQAFWTLRIGLGLAAFLAGLDKFFNLLTNWEKYLSPLAEKVIPLSATAFMHIAGVIEMVAGIALLAGATRLFGYIVMLWLLGIAANLVSTGIYFDVAVRDVEMALASFVLAKLTEVRMRATASSTEYPKIAKAA